MTEQSRDERLIKSMLHKSAARDNLFFPSAYVPTSEVAGVYTRQDENRDFVLKSGEAVRDFVTKSAEPSQYSRGRVPVQRYGAQWPYGFGKTYEARQGASAYETKKRILALGFARTQD